MGRWQVAVLSGLDATVTLLLHAKLQRLVNVAHVDSLELKLLRCLWRLLNSHVLVQGRVSGQEDLTIGCGVAQDDTVVPLLLQVMLNFDLASILRLVLNNCKQMVTLQLALLATGRRKLATGSRDLGLLAAGVSSRETRHGGLHVLGNFHLPFFASRRLLALGFGSDSHSRRLRRNTVLAFLVSRCAFRLDGLFVL